MLAINKIVTLQGDSGSWLLIANSTLVPLGWSLSVVVDFAARERHRQREPPVELRSEAPLHAESVSNERASSSFHRFVALDFLV